MVRQIEVEIEQREEIAAEQSGDRPTGNLGHRQRADRHAGIAGQRSAAQWRGAETQRAGQGVWALLKAADAEDRGCHPVVAFQAETANHVLAHQCALCAGIEDERRRGFIDQHGHQDVAVDGVNRNGAQRHDAACRMRRGGDEDREESEHA